MKKEQLSSTKMLRFVRHDFLNELQMILAHMDLGNLPEAKNVIKRTTEVMKEHSKLERLGLPKTEKWIATFEWVYTAFRKSLVCNIKPGNRIADDQEILDYLQNLFHDVEKILDPISEYEVLFNILASEHNWLLTITITGALPNKKSTTTGEGKVSAGETIASNLWTFTIRGQ